MSLVNSNRKKRLDRGEDISPVETFSMDKKIEDETIEKEYKPIPTTLKINSQIRDQINTLSLIGYGNTQKEVIEKAIQVILDNMTKDERQKFENQYKIIEEKTIKNLEKK